MLHLTIIFNVFVQSSFFFFLKKKEGEYFSAKAFCKLPGTSSYFGATQRRGFDRTIVLPRQSFSM